MATTEAGVVCDAGPLIHLGELAAIDLLADFERVLIPEQVWAEVARHFPAALSQSEVTLTRHAVDIPTDARFQAMVRAFALDLGEQAALALMAQYPDAILLTDDTAARLAAQGLSYRVHGTLGILVRAIRRGRRTAAAVIDLLHALPDRSTLHISPALLRQVIAEVEQAHGLS